MPLFNDTITLGVRADLTQFEQDILSATAKATARMKPINLQLNNGVSQPLGKITGDISQFNKSLDAASARVLAFSASVGIINGVVKGFRDLVKETIAVEKALTDINVVLNTNQQGLDNFSNSLFDIARNTGQSFKAVADAALEFSRQGLSVQETLKRTNDALVLSRISGLDAADSVKTLTAAINGFNKEALDTAGIVNKLAAVDSNFAVSTKDLAEALTRVGSTADDANVSFNELVATVTAVQQTTSRGGAVIGNALKTIFTRISRESTIQQLRELGVQIDQSQNGIEKLRAISAAVERVDKSTANTIKELSGGVFQINTVTAALGDLSKEYSVYDNALKIANGSTDEAIRRNEALNQTLDALSKQAGANIDQLFSKIGKISLGGNLKALFSSFNSITQTISESLDGDSIGAKLGQGLLQGLGNFLTGPAAIVAIGAFSKLVLQIGGDAVKSFRSIAGITSEADKQALLTKTIGDRLAANSNLYEGQLLANKGILAIQQDILSQLAREAELRAAIAKIAPNIAQNISSSLGVSKGTIVPRGASGIIPALIQEKVDVTRGVGGASRNASPVFIPRFNSGNGYGPIVANTSEKIVENFMGGKGSAVLNPDMIAALGGESKLSKYGNVKQVAEGYTPNFTMFDILGGKVNIKRKGNDIVLDEILAGFDEAGNRKSGTGIVREAFDLAVDQGKKLGAENLIVDIINSKVAASLNGNPRFSGFGTFGIGKFKLPLSALASGYIPSLAQSPLGDAVNREVNALVNQGHPLPAVQGAIRVDKSPALVSPQNPGGFGVFNTIQGQTTLNKALSDHRGENLRAVGAAGGFVPSFAKFQGFGIGDLKNTQNQNVAVAVLDEVNQLLTSITNSLDPKARQADIQKISTLYARLGDKSVELVERQLDVAVDFSAKRILAPISGRGLTKSTGGQLGKDVIDNINDQLRKAATTTSQVEFQGIAKDLSKLEGDVSKGSFERIKKALLQAGKFGQEGRQTTIATSEDIFASAQSRVAKRGLLSTTSVSDILKSEQGFSNLPSGEQALLRERLAAEGKANRRQSFERASLGIAFAGSLATPFIDQGADALRKGGNTGAATALSGASGALTGASFGAILGPEGAAAGALIGGVISLGKAMDGSASKAEDLTKKLDDLQAKTTANLNSFNSYVQTQQKLNTIIEEGGKESDIAAVRQQLGQIFSSISDPKLRQDIVATTGDIKSLSEAFAKAQAIGIQDTKRQEAITVASQEKAKNTNFFGARTQGLFSASAIGDISRSLIAGAPDKSLKDFAQSIKDADGNLTRSDFAEKLKKIGVDADQAGSLFDDLEKPLNRLLLLRGLKENLDLADDLKKATDAAIKYKKSITDLNKTIGTLTALQSSDTRASLGFQTNAFNTQQNGAQLAAALKFITAGQFGQSQISSAFEARRIGFTSEQERLGTRNDLASQVATFVAANREKIGIDKDFTKKLDEFILTGGKGDINSLANQAVLKGTGTGEEFKAFAELGVTLTEARNKLASIDDSEKNQLTVLRQNLAALKERIQLENKINLLGGAEGQINFGTSGFDKFARRESLSTLQGLGGDVGSFGRNQNALGILEFQKSFGGVDGLDVRKIIPNAEQVVSDSIKQSLVEGFGRLNIPVTPESLKQFDSVAKLSASKQFEKKELTATEIGEAVGSSFKYNELSDSTGKAFGSALGSSKVTEYTSVIPEIRSFLASRFGLERERVQLSGDATSVEKKIAGIQAQIQAKSADINLTKSEGAQIISAPKRNIGLFNNAALQAANAADVVAAGSGLAGIGNASEGIKVSINDRDLASLASLASGQIAQLIPSNGNATDFRQNINNAVNKQGLFGGNDFLRTALLTQFQGGFGTDSKGQRAVTDETFGKIITALEKAGGVTLGSDAQTRIAKDASDITDLNKQLPPLQDEFKTLTDNIKKLNDQIEAANTKGPAATATARSGALVTASKPFVDTVSAALAKSTEQQLAKVRGIEADKANAEATARRQNQLNFGNLDTATIDRLSESRTNLKNVGGKNSNIEEEIRSLESTLLRQAQLQQLTLGRSDPRLASVIGNGSFGQNSIKISANSAQQSFQDLVKQANAAFVSGFVTESDLTKIGIKISQGLEDYVRAQVKLGVPENEARDAGKKLREGIQKELDKLDVKLPNNKLQEFGQGFKSRTEELQKSFDDLGQLGSNTADSLINGFGDAFSEVASGAKNAGDAVRGMLSSVALDISKFFAKRAFAQIFAAAVGNSSAGSFGGFGTGANGGLMTFAQGGSARNVPALVMGGERAFSPETVRAYGVDFFKDLNAGKIPKNAKGVSGMIQGGSGYKDDLMHLFPENTFILQKAAVNKYGKDYLDQIDNAAQHAQGGKVQHAFFGALLGAILSKAITGAVVGAATAKLTGGDWKKGAILGGIAGGVAGGIGGYSAAQSATGSFGSQFGSSFSNGFSYLGFGDKSSAAGSANGTPNSGTNLPSADSLKFDSKLPTLDSDSLKLANTNATLASLNGGNATGIGNQSLTLGQTAAKPSIFKTAGINLAASLGLALASAALAPKAANGSGSNIVQGNGSVTQYNPDGSVSISTASGTSKINRSEYSSTTELQNLISQRGGSLPQGGLPTFAQGGMASGSGSVTIKDKKILDRINKQFAGGFALGGYVGLPKMAKGGMTIDKTEIDSPMLTNSPAALSRIEKVSLDKASIAELTKGFSMGGYANAPLDKPVGMFSVGGDIDGGFSKPTNPYITSGSGIKDDVYLKAKRGEYILNDKATSYYGLGLVNRMNSMQISKQDMEARSRVGILAFANGGVVEAAPADRDRGLFSISGASNPPSVGQPSRGGGGGGTSISIEINMNGNGGATVATKSGDKNASDDKNSVDGQKFASKVKQMFLELVDQEKRPGGSLSKENL